MTTKYRDMIFLLQFGVQLLMYATPVVYPSSEIPNAAAKALSWNPLGPIFEMARYGLLGAGEVSMTSIAYTVCFAAVATLVSALVFDQVQRTAMDTI
ncbi:polysaccharide ABC transporter permease protein [Rhodopirellula sallentina SM41]|uniref:Polysaccharide ABC transporter permease protein n=1 Tax=Rhodopirellula sallentina SM41 TaxID=1263870 RepID=M5U0D7_9BACT|nr:polysaccharide ABC transporter permease protein [Rhodopirellula sallentina SM41]